MAHGASNVAATQAAPAGSELYPQESRIVQYMDGAVARLCSSWRRGRYNAGAAYQTSGPGPVADLFRPDDKIAKIDPAFLRSTREERRGQHWAGCDQLMQGLIVGEMIVDVAGQPKDE